MGIIKDHATSELRGNTLILQGTNINQTGDILADVFLLVPYYMKGIGFVSLGAYLQGKAVYKKHKKALFELDNVTLSGHSLGGGIACIVALMLRNNGYMMQMRISSCGGIKVLSRRTRNFLYSRMVLTDWKVNHRDIVPFLGWWKEPVHFTPRTGAKRKHIFDWSAKAHLDY